MHSSTNSSPFRTLYAYDPEWMTHPGAQTAEVPTADERAELLKEIHSETKASIQIAAERMKRHYDRGVAEAPKFDIGEEVWLDAKNVLTTQPSRKLADKRLGPFKVIAKVGPLDYRLELPPTMKIHPVFHVELLYKRPTDCIEGRAQEPPPPVEVAGHEEYEVKDILDSRMHRGKLQYQVKWLGYSPAESIWEPPAHIAHAPNLVSRFHQTHPSAPRRLNATAFRNLMFHTFENLTDTQTATPWEDGRLSN